MVKLKRWYVAQGNLWYVAKFVIHQTLPFVSGSNVAQTGFKLNSENSLQLLIQLSGAKGYMCVMGIEPRILHVLRKYPTNRPPQSFSAVKRH